METLQKLRNILRRMESCANVRALLCAIQEAKTEGDASEILARAIHLRIIRESACL